MEGLGTGRGHRVLRVFLRRRQDPGPGPARPPGASRIDAYLACRDDVAVAIRAFSSLGSLTPAHAGLPLPAAKATLTEITAPSWGRLGPRRRGAG